MQYFQWTIVGIIKNRLPHIRKIIKIEKFKFHIWVDGRIKYLIFQFAWNDVCITIFYEFYTRSVHFPEFVDLANYNFHGWNEFCEKVLIENETGKNYWSWIGVILINQISNSYFATVEWFFFYFHQFFLVFKNVWSFYRTFN